MARRRDEWSPFTNLNPRDMDGRIGLILLVFSLATLLAIVLMLATPISNSIRAAQQGRSAASSASDDEQANCKEEGRAYYRAIGSYPTWSTGEHADDKIEEMCSRNSLMFHDINL